MQKLIFLNDWFFNEKLIYDCFGFFRDRYELNISKTYDLLNISKNDIIIGWGSGCLDIMGIMNEHNIENTKILISPYLDYNYFIYNFSEESDEFETEYQKKAGILENKYIAHDKDVSENYGRVIYPDKEKWFRNTYVFFGDSDKLIPLQYYLYLADMYNGCSFHLIENAGFAPFYNNNSFFDILEANTPL